MFPPGFSGGRGWVFRSPPRRIPRCISLELNMPRSRGRKECIAILGAMLACSMAGLTGCERSERVLDIEAPGVDVEVDRTEDGDVDVHVDEDPD